MRPRRRHLRIAIWILEIWTALSVTLIPRSPLDPSYLPSLSITANPNIQSVPLMGLHVFAP